MIQNKIIQFLLFTLLIGTCFPMFHANFGLSIMYPSFAILIVIIIFFYQTIFFNKTFLWILIHALIWVLFSFFSKNGITLYFFSYSLLPLTITMIYIEYFIKKKDSKDLSNFIYISLSLLIFRCITAIIAENIFPNAARNMGLEEAGMGSNLTEEMSRIGVATYPFVSALPFMLIPFIYLVKDNSSPKIKFFFIVLGSLALFTIIKTSWGAAVLFSIIAIILGFSIKNSRKTSFVLLPLLATILILGFFVTEILDFLITMFTNNQTLLAKVNDIQASLQEGQKVGQLQQRGDLYDISIQTFFKNPFLGDFDGKTGGHAFWIDSLARFGIFGTIPLFMVIISIYNQSLKYIPPDYKYLSLINLILFFAYGCVKNLGGYELFIFPLFVAPFTVYIFSKPKNGYLKNIVQNQLLSQTHDLKFPN